MSTAAVLALVSFASAAAPAPSKAEGSITGRIVYAGEAPAPKKIDPTTDAAICGQQDLVEESLIVDPKTKGIRDVAVWIEGTQAPKPSAPPAIDNYRCRFEPHVLVVAAGTEVVIRNRDRFLHTTQAKDAGGKSLFNVALPTKDQEVKKSFKAPGAYSLRCDVHDWMRGVVVVNKGERAAVTGANGELQIEGVAPGKHKVHLWHETLGERVEEITVKAGEPAKLELSWAKKP